MVVTNIGIIVIMLMIIKQDIEYHKDEYCYHQCHFFLLYWLSRITGEQELDSSGNHREPWPARHPKVREKQRGGWKWPMRTIKSHLRFTNTFMRPIARCKDDY